MVLGEGACVHLIITPNTRMGTISRSSDQGKACIIFHHHQRFGDTIPDMFGFDCDIEESERPSDEQVTLINALVKRGRNGPLAEA